jgi:hypothetical protein
METMEVFDPIRLEPLGAVGGGHRNKPGLLLRQHGIELALGD